MSHPRGPYWRAVERFPRVRQSALSTFDSCGLSSRFEMTYTNGWSTHPQARGTAFHRLAADCLRTMAALGETTIPVDVALAHLHETLRQADVDLACPHCNAQEVKPGIRDGLRTCGACARTFPTDLMNLPMHEVKDLYWMTKKWAHDNEWDISNLIDVEERLTVPLSYPDGSGGSVLRHVTGQMDATFQAAGDPSHAIVLDWKTSFAVPGPTTISFEGYFQQRMYGWLIMKTYRNVNSVTLREFYVRFSEPREVRIWREDLDEIEQEFSALVERFDRAVHDDAYTPSPGRHCQWCIRPSACPIGAEARDEGRITSQAEAEKVGRQVLVAERVLKQSKGALSSWANIHGPIPVRDAKGARVLGYRETTTQRRPSKEALELALREAGSLSGLNVDKLFPVSKGTRFEQFAPPRVQPTDDDAALLANLEGALAEARAGHHEDAV